MSIASSIAGQMANAGKDRTSTSTTKVTSDQQTGILDSLLPILELYMYATMFSDNANPAGKGMGANEIAKNFSLAAPGLTPGAGIPQFNLAGNYASGPLPTGTSNAVSALSQNANPLQIIGKILGITDVPAPKTSLALNPEVPASTIRDKSAQGWTGTGGIDPTVLMFLLQNIPAMQQLIKGGK